LTITSDPSFPSNVGSWRILSYISSSSVTIQNPSAVTDAGAAVWSTNILILV
jgi:hypothetical protein